MVRKPEIEMKLRWKKILLPLFGHVLALPGYLFALGRSMYGFFSETKGDSISSADAGDSTQVVHSAQFRGGAAPSGEKQIALPTFVDDGPHSVYTGANCWIWTQSKIEDMPHVFPFWRKY